MHDAALAYMAAMIWRHHLAGNVLDLGGRDVNGTPRHLFINADRYVVVDIEPAVNVDIVADAATLELDERFDVVVSTELFEHTAAAPEIVATAWRHLAPGGTFVATMAGVRREPHSAFDGGQLRAGEFYRNVTEDDLTGWLVDAGFTRFEVDDIGTDIRCTAWRNGD